MTISAPRATGSHTLSGAAGSVWRVAGLAAWLILAASACRAIDGPATTLEPSPGAPPRSSELSATLSTALADQPQGYVPRTHHLTENGSPRFVNRLIQQSSPYLLQHAHNPVDWHPWGREAFALATLLDRPVLLSIGYSTCHWCHVMERESFEDLEIARFINENFVAIKVDREERPDIDAIYMAAVQLVTGRGGWPMTVWLTPEAEPFFGGTYFPARDGDRGASVGFLTLLGRIKTAYDVSRDDVRLAGSRLTAAVRSSLDAVTEPVSTLPGVDVVDRTALVFHQRFDTVHGGTQGAPKFPSTTPLRLLLRHYNRTGDSASLEMAVGTLESMAAGGIHDQVGGGFHRYSTDAQWLVPHFEKMLYDNALLARAYLEAYQLTDREDFAHVARGVLDYAMREMSSPEGGFFSATDADSPAPGGHDEEGLYFTWTPEELSDVLGAQRSRIVGHFFGVSAGGNYEGRSILHRGDSPEEVEKTLGLSAGAVETALRDSLPLLYAARQLRPPPILDDKILTAWNGLMISSLAVAARTFDEAVYAERARAAGDFIWNNMQTDGRLVRAYRAGSAGNPAVLEDYAFLIAGFLDLFETTFDPTWLSRSQTLQASLDAHYPAPQGGYYRTADDSDSLLARERPIQDGARPSGNSVAALNLLRLAEFTSDDDYRAKADRLVAGLGSRLEEQAAGLTELLVAVEFRQTRVQEVVIVAPTAQDAEPFLDRLRTRFAPHQVLVVADDTSHAELARLVPLLAGKVAQEGKATAYVCEQGFCELPTTDIDKFEAQLSTGLSGRTTTGGG